MCMHVCQSAVRMHVCLYCCVSASLQQIDQGMPQKSITVHGEEKERQALHVTGGAHQTNFLLVHLRRTRA